MVSIIIPVYNGEPFLDECIQSILEQTYSDFELVLVDDGSTDDSLFICQKYMAADKRIKCVSTVNGGANAARGIGVKHASGDYIMFVDADDTINCDALERLMDIVNNHPYVDILSAHESDSIKVVYGHQFLIDLLKSTCGVAMCFKIYKAEILKRYFKEIPRSLKYGEDLLQNINIAKYVNKVVYCNIKYYKYRMVETSVSHTMQFSQEYENEYHKFLSTLLFESSFVDNLSEELSLNLKMSWFHCRINGLKNVALFSHSKINFQDSEYLKFKSLLKPYMSYLNTDERILLCSPSCVSGLLLSLYMCYCRLKNAVKKTIFHYR